MSQYQTDGITSQRGKQTAGIQLREREFLELPTYVGERRRRKKKKKTKILGGFLISITSVVEQFPLRAGYFPAQ